MKIGVIGLGNISQKAYLPIMASMQNEIDWVLCTRDPVKRQQLQLTYGFKKSVATIDDLLNQQIDACFVHTPTDTHYEIIKRLLNNQVHVMVDKPISENIEEVKELMQLAQHKQLIFDVGFNRRYAPFVQRIKQENHDSFMIQKNRINKPMETRYALYDLLIHPLDTAVELLNGQEKPKIHFVQKKMSNHLLEQVQLQLSSGKKTACVSMNLTSGANLEVIQAMSSKGTQFLTNLSRLETYQEGKQMINVFGDWDAILYQRGFQTMVEQFIVNVEKGKIAKSTLQNNLYSHELCNEILISESMI